MNAIGTEYWIADLWKAKASGINVKERFMYVSGFASDKNTQELASSLDGKILWAGDSAQVVYAEASTYQTDYTQAMEKSSAKR